MGIYKNINIEDFNYPLPSDRIAKYPLKERGGSNLLVWQNGTIKQDCFRNIANYLPANSFLIFNNTRVTHARMFFKKKSGAKIEIFCLEPESPPDHQQAFETKDKVIFKCLVGNAKKWKEEALLKKININGKNTILSVRKIEKKDNIYIIEFSWDTDFPFTEIIKNTGILPIPPYLKRDTEQSDEFDYQTVYAKYHGSVAAPTAGLHFTESILKELSNKNIETSEITLHVGAGTFQPVKSEKIEDHTMHDEKVCVPKNVIEKLIFQKEKVIPVGTTSVRSLESLYWLGLKLGNKKMPEEKLSVDQWEPYKINTPVSGSEALHNIIGYMDRTSQDTIRFSTRIIIVPGYDFKLTGGMITNFHQPKSTLLLLISAFLGNEWKKVYDYALNNGFRFLSYGDSNLYLK